MKTQDSFPFLVNSILGELEKASRIRIDCLPADETNKGNNGTVLKASSVNGLATPREFHDLIRHLKAEALMKFREVIPQIAPCDADAFIGLAQRRVRRMMRPVVAEGHQGRGAPQEGQG